MVHEKDRILPAAKGRIVEGGRVILPAAFRKSTGLAKGDTVLMELHGDEVRIRPARSALRRLQEKLRDCAPENGLVSDELVAVVPVGQDVAEEAARLRSVSKEAGLSLGDRFCLALAKSLGAPALATDRAWKEIAKAAGVEVEIVH